MRGRFIVEYLGCFAVVMAVLLIGQWVASLTKAWVPSVFVSAIVFLIGFWTILPKDIAVKASYDTAFVQICVSMLLVHLGTLMSLKKLIAQWRAVCIALLGVAGTLLLTMTIGTLLFDWHTVLASVPPLTGGVVAALLMTNGLKDAGLTAFVALPVTMLMIHGVFGYPLTAIMLKHEDRRLAKVYQGMSDEERAQAAAASSAMAQSDTDKPTQSKFLSLFPEKYQTSAFILLRVALVALFSNWIAGLTNGVVNANVVCLIFGVIAHQLGFLEDSALNKAGVFDWLMYGLLGYVFSQLAGTTPQQLLSMLLQILVLIVLGLIGMFVASFILGKPFGMSHEMAFACSLTALFGFPADYILTTEVAHNVAKDEGEERYLLDNTLPQMLVGGFATVSIASVIIASVFLKLL